MLRNPIRIVDKETNEILHAFYTRCIDDTLSEMRHSGILKSFTMKYGSNFRFVDKFDKTIQTENENNFALSNILNLLPEEGTWKEFYVERDS